MRVEEIPPQDHNGGQLVPVHAVARGQPRHTRRVGPGAAQEMMEAQARRQAAVSWPTEVVPGMPWCAGPAGREQRPFGP